MDRLNEFDQALDVIGFDVSKIIKQLEIIMDGLKKLKTEGNFEGGDNQASADDEAKAEMQLEQLESFRGVIRKARAKINKECSELGNLIRDCQLKLPDFANGNVSGDSEED